MIEYLFPQSPLRCIDKCFIYYNRSTWTSLKSGQAFRNPAWSVLFSGSRVEGLHLGNGQGPGASDWDYMYLYGGEWGVNVTSGCREIESETSALMLDQSQSPPGYCRIRMVAVEKSVIQRMGQTCGRGRYTVLPTLLLLPVFLISCLTFYLCHDKLNDMLNIDISPIFYFFIVFHYFIIFPLLYKLCKIQLFSSILHHTGNLPVFRTISKLFRIGTTNSMKCIADRDGEYFLSSQVTINVLHDIYYHAEKFSTYHGPAQTYKDRDYVPALICSAPFPWIARYVCRPRSPRWPSKNALVDIQILPGILVPTGKKGSVDHDLQWRQSCSLLEIRLAQDMPDWVKTAFRTFKATMKFVKKRVGDKDSRHTVLGSRFIARVLRLCVSEKPSEIDASVVCSFHLKNVLLWLLEEADTWKQMCSFRLMIQLLVRLDHHLKAGHLPHYFNPECNLLDNVHDVELVLTRNCVKIILSDPVDAMIKACVKASRGLPITLGKTADYWLSPKCYLASIHREFQEALVSTRAQCEGECIV